MKESIVMSPNTRGASFAAPGKGTWRRLADHFPGAVTPEYLRIYSETVPAGMSTYMQRYGVAAKTVEVAAVSGHLYISPRPLAGPAEVRRTPPRIAVWLMARLHPAFRQRKKAAAKTLDERPWRAVTERWFAEEADEWAARAQALQDADLAGLGDAELVDHLRSCRALVVSGYRRHFELHGDDVLPIGLLLARATDWGIDPAVVLNALRGAPGLPRRAANPPLWQLVTGYDLDARAWCEIGTPAPNAAPEGAADHLRDVVPAEHHAELALLVADASAAVSLRDHNGVYTAAWPMGLLRRAMLESGRRLALVEPEHAVELTVDELVRRLEGGEHPSHEDIEQRAERRRADSLLDPPATFGPELAIPPLDALPPALGVISAAQLAAAEHMLPADAAAIGVGDRTYRGRALVVDDPAEAFDELCDGDVVVTTATSPSWNVVLASAGALVTSFGGQLSHAAVIARELGLVALIGDPTAVDRVRTGMTVEVDPVRATLTVVAGTTDAPR